MATNTQSLIWDNVLLANFKAWGQSVGTALTAFGWSKDSTIAGTVNWAGLNFTPYLNTSISIPAAATNYLVRGAWANTGVTYAINDVVTSAGATWYCQAGYTPTTASASPENEFLSGGTQHWVLFPYEVWKSAGAVPIYLRFEYIGISGTVNSTANPRIRITFGTSDVDNLILSSVANASGGNTVYTGTSGFSATTNAYVNATFTITGFTNGANNGTFTCVASTSTGSGAGTLTLNNSAGVAETKNALATLFNGNLGTPAGQAKGGPADIIPVVNTFGGFGSGKQLTCFFSGDSTNRFSMLMWPELPTVDSVNGSGFFCVERSLDNTGNYYTTPSGVGFIQGQNDVYTNHANTISKTFLNNNTAGNLIIVFASNVGTSAAGIAISDTQGNTYHPFNTADLTVNALAQIGWYATGINAGANTVTVTWTTGGTQSSALGIAEYTGISAFDQLSTIKTGSGAWSTNSVTTTQAEELLVSIAVAAGDSVTATGNAATRQILTSGGSTFGIIADATVSSIGTYSSSGGSAGNYMAVLASFKATPNSPPITPYWTAIWWGYNGGNGGTGFIGSLLNTAGSNWIATSFDTTPSTVTAELFHGNIPEGIQQSMGAGTGNQSMPAFPIWPLVGWVGNPLTAVMSTKTLDAPGFSTFTVPLYGVTHTFLNVRNDVNAFTGFGASTTGSALTNNGLAMRFD